MTCGEQDISPYNAFTLCTSHKELMNITVRIHRFHSSPWKNEELCVIGLSVMINDSMTPGGLGKYACGNGFLHSCSQTVPKKHDSRVRYWNCMWKQQSREETCGHPIVNYVSPWFVWSRGSCNNSRRHCSCFSLSLKVTFEKHKASCLQ
jgi:hypothetical protein